MSWATPRDWTTGELVTKVIMDGHVRDLFAYLKGTSGAISYEDSLVSDTDKTDDLGTPAIRWRNIHGMRYRRHARRVVINWEVADLNASSQPDNQVSYREATGGEVRRAGSGQIGLKVDRDSAGSLAGVEQETELTPGGWAAATLGNEWTVTKNPDFSFVIGLLAALPSDVDVFIGFRATPSNAIPINTEIHAGLFWDGTNWFFTNSGGAGSSTSSSTFALGAGWHVVDVYIRSAVAVDYVVDGTLYTVTATLPTGTMDWAYLLLADGGGPAADAILTVGGAELQEEP